ncbi:hypothetical protein CPB83DRAFT_812965 [Crepidotus variabilis]|uniref:Zinc finger Mcm10/DnaG-type domain-containing protein n=1 Tax=Crepidotus variabilis TaxID=179855 RepID=A0A9P6EHG1_9AGAR|nr:hypothetical protein CPB83DRAFT_812965 [Crepidotus variabilis]
MNSSTSRTNEQKQTQDEIKRQIALLQAQLKPERESDLLPPKGSPKRKASVVTLAPATPSPKKKRKINDYTSTKSLAAPVFQSGSKQTTGGLLPRPKEKGKGLEEVLQKPSPSNFLNKLSNLSHQADLEERKPVKRSSGFKDMPEESLDIPKRDERLAIVEDFEPGPYEHNPPVDDPTFEKLEPHSGIRIVSRTIPHEDFSDYLRGRYYLSPSRLYSVIRLLPDKQGYEVPVPGDWVTIAVIAERGPIRYTKAPVTLDKDRDEKHRHWKNKDGGEAEKPSGGKKFVNIRLIDFGARTGSSSSANGGKSVIRGDAYLNLLLFEADAFDLVPREDGRKPEKLYRGGSGGAFEHLTNTKEGDVIALLNPKILKPYQRSNDRPHPTDNVLALTPENASSIMVLGRSKDLGMCTVRKQDGKVCGSWCDKRLSDVCEYHVMNAVASRRAARPEFTAGTSGMSTTSKHKNQHEYDPRKKWGLQPSESSGGGSSYGGSSSTYVISGHVVSGTSSDSRTIYETENIGREGQAKAKRLLDAKESDRALKALLSRDKDGMRAVMKARKVGAAMAKEEKNLKKHRGRKNEKASAQKSQQTDSEDDEDGEEDISQRKTLYSAEFVKALGFDPSLKGGPRRPTGKVQEKLDELEAVRSSRKTIKLGSRPGPKVRSGVVVPAHHDESMQDNSQEAEVNLDDSEDKKMVDLDDL